MLRLTMITLVVLGSGLVVGCGGPEAPSNCVIACEADNACKGHTQYNCPSLCDAVPDSCAAEHTAYWDCAFAHRDQVCSRSYASACSSEFGSFAPCAAFWCLFHPLDAACYYLKK